MYLLPSIVPLAESHGHGDGSFIEEYLELMGDPAHVGVEITFLVIEMLLIGLAFPVLRRYIRRKMDQAHHEFDRDHGITHDPETGEIIKED